jgi:hypothetical protein
MAVAMPSANPHTQRKELLPVTFLRTSVFLSVFSACLLAHDTDQQITVPSNGVDYRAACEDSTGTTPNPGVWVFTVSAASGKLSKLAIQVWSNAAPSTVEGEPRVCSAYTGTGFDSLGRPQAMCPNMSVGPLQKTAEVTLAKPKTGQQAAVTLPAGARCIRPVLTGNGSVTVTVAHPK